MAIGKNTLAGTYDFTVQKGTDWAQTFDVTANDLTGWTARAHFREDIDDADPPIIDLTTENGGIVINGGSPDSDYELIMTDAITKAITQDQLVYDVEFINPAGDVFRLQEGTTTFSPEVTRE